jgi:hypothetical protein
MPLRTVSTKAARVLAGALVAGLVVTPALRVRADTATPAPRPQPAASAPALPRQGLAAAVPASTASPGPASTATPAPPTWRTTFDGFASFIDQATNGPGTQPPEGPAFAKGSPLSPMTPYDTFSSAPQTPGVAGVSQLLIDTGYTGRRIITSLRLGLLGVDGSITNAVYWTEPLLAPFNPHVGSTVLPFSIVFPTHAGQDDGAFAGAALSSLSVQAPDGGWRVQAGAFDLAQTIRCVFVQPALPNVPPALTLAPAESLGDGPPTLDGWPQPPPGLPLRGVDLTGTQGKLSAEFSDGLLPSLPGTSARVVQGSLALHAGEDSNLMLQVLHLTTGGALIATTTLFGADPVLVDSPQGRLPVSTLGNQVMTAVGLHAEGGLGGRLRGVADVARTWYDAQHVFAPGTSHPGGFYHAGISSALGRLSVGLDGYKFEPRYSTAILPYGVPENVWSVAWSWPGVWLKSTYQLADNTVVGANRQGYRVHVDRDSGRLTWRADFAEFHQIQPSAIDESHDTGFVEGFFLPQLPRYATLGLQKQVGVWVAWHTPFATLTLDGVDDMMHRDAATVQPQDAVSYEAPQLVFSLSKQIRGSLLAALGVGRYAMRGSWAHGPVTNVDYQQDVIFGGAQCAESPHAVVLVELRHGGFAGLPSIPGGPSPDYHDTLVVVEQRFHY